MILDRVGFIFGIGRISNNYTYHFVVSLIIRLDGSQMKYSRFWDFLWYQSQNLVPKPPNTMSKFDDGSNGKNIVSIFMSKQS